MKKFLAILLTLSLLVSSLFVFTSCKKDSEDENKKEEEKLTVEAVQQDALSALMSSSEKTTNAFYGTKDDVLETIKNALANGSTSLTLQSDSLMGPFKKINGVLYTNKDKGALDLNLNFNGKDIGATLFVDKSAIVLQDRNLMNLPSALSLTYDTFVKNLDTSALKEIFQFDDVASQQIKAYIDQIKSALEASGNAQSNDESLNEIKTLFKFEVADETVEINGENVETIKVSTNITEQFILDFVKVSVKNADMDDVDRDSLIVNLENELKNYKLNASLQANINIKTKLIVKDEFKIDLDDANGNKILKFEAYSTFTDNKISEKMLADMGDVKFDINIDITKTVKDGVTSIDTVFAIENETGKLALTVSKQSSDKLDKSEISLDFTDKELDPEKVGNILKISSELNKESGDFEVSLELNSDVIGNDPSAAPKAEAPQKINLAFNGNIAHKDGKFTFAINSMTMGDITVAFKLIAEFDTNAKVPALPESSKEITELTESEIAEMMQALQTSPFFEIIATMQGSNDPAPVN